MQDPTKANHSVDKVLQIIETLAEAREPMRLIDISEKVKMPTSTILRMITSLMERGYAYQDPQTSRYGLSLRFAQIGYMVLDQFNIRNVVHPYLVNLVRECSESACLAIEQDMRITYLDVVENTDSMIKVRQSIGKYAPMHATGSGKVFLSQFTDDQLDELVARHGLPAYTSYTISSLSMLKKGLENVRAQGFAIDDQECELGVRCIAAPLVNYQNKVVGAISLSGPVSRMSYQRVEELSARLCETAAQISSTLLYQT